MPTPTPWIARVYAEERANNLTRAYTRVLTSLATFCGPGGLAWPSHETLAERSDTSVSTVQRALKAARGLGLVEWTERRVRAGWRWLRTSNSYRLLLPSTSVERGPPRLWWRRPTTGHADRGGVTTGKEEARQSRKAEQEAWVEHSATLPNYLKRRGQQVAAGLVDIYWSKRAAGVKVPWPPAPGQTSRWRSFG